MYFHLNTAVLSAILLVIVLGAAVIGMLVGRTLRSRGVERHESFGVVQGTLLGLVGLLLAFGLTMSVGRYEARRALVVDEANAIGTTYLRAQLLAEPERTESLHLLRRYTDAAVDLASKVPGTATFVSEEARMDGLQQSLWALAGDAVAADPTGTAPRLYVEALNPMIDVNGSRVASLGNRVPSTVMLLQVVGSAIAVGLLSLHLALLGRGVIASLLAALLVTLILFISFDLDRPERGFITVPRTALVNARAAMDGEPAAGP